MIDPLIKTAVIGHPIAHSKSPHIHNAWLRQYGISGSYKAVDVKPDELSSAVQGLVDDGYAGFNVTLPHKVAVMALCDEVDETARRIGAVNTVSIQDGRLFGTNTDAFGFTHNILQSCQRNAWNDWSFAGGAAMVLGAGGAARAVVFALLEQGVPEIILLNRTLEKAQDLAAQMDKTRITVVPWIQRNSVCTDANLIVNTTALGMDGKPILEIDLASTPSHALINDLVYAPLHTDLLHQADLLGLRYVTGIGMLLHQARPGFELWNGIMPEVTPELEERITS
ncbi:MAG: shikimate dehydrogenase [Alphaproteobacteria bacterium]